MSLVVSYARNVPSLMALGNSSITESEIAAELYYNRNYTSGTVTPTTTTTLTRQQCIGYGTDKGLAEYGYPKKATTLTYIDVNTYSNIIARSKYWANQYLTGAAVPTSSSITGLRGLGQYTYPYIPPPQQTGFRGWGLLLTLVGQGIITYGNYLMYKNMMTQQGYSFQQMPTTTYDQYAQQLRAINPSLTDAQIREILSPYGAKSEIPTWVWVAGAGLAVYAITKRG